MLLIYAWCLLLSLGAVVINQVSVGWRVAIFLVLLACSALFATRLHLFEPVLRHHYNPKTQQDEIVTPDDPAFAAEERAAAEMREERLEHLIPLFEPVLRHHYNPKTQQDEIVTPDDPAFAAEERAAAEMREERLEHLIPGKSPKSTDSHK